jgi:transcription elongation factor GreB
MSRAFVKEQDEEPGGDLPDRPVSEHVNYVTPAGLRQLEQSVGALEEQRLALLAQANDASAQERLAYVDRDLRYFGARLASARPVDTAAQPRDKVAFGAAVTVTQAGAAPRTFTIVGEDEADTKSGKISYVSPLAVALLGAGRGDTVVWKRPAGDVRLTVKRIEYPEG